MFVVRPVLKHFILWLALTPVFLLEAMALHEFFNALALRDPTRSQRVMAKVTEVRYNGSEVLVRYRFRVPGSLEWYTASDMTGRKNLWIQLKPNAWEQAQKQDNQIEIVYLPENPWVNRPTEQAESPVANALCLWFTFFAIDVIWFWETYHIVRDYTRCLDAAAERRACSTRFWEVCEV